MKKLLKIVGTGALIWMLMSSVALAGISSPKSQNSSSNDLETLKVVFAAMRSRVFIQTVAKDYLYIGNDVATTQAQKEMAGALKKFDKQQETLANAFTDSKIKNLMVFVKMNVDEIKDTLKKPYSLDHAQEIIDLAEAVSEGNKKIAGYLKKKLSRQYPVGKGQRYMIIQVAKYYMAYESGIKDANTIRHMKQTVQNLDSLFQEMKAYPKNTVEINQVLNKIDRLWKIVKQFYVDIEEGGLPVIVFQTTNKIDKELIEYAHLFKKIAAKK